MWRGYCVDGHKKHFTWLMRALICHNQGCPLLLSSHCIFSFMLRFQDLRYIATSSGVGMIYLFFAFFANISFANIVRPFVQIYSCLVVGEGGGCVFFIIWVVFADVCANMVRFSVQIYSCLVVGEGGGGSGLSSASHPRHPPVQQLASNLRISPLYFLPREIQIQIQMPSTSPSIFCTSFRVNANTDMKDWNKDWSYWSENVLT